MTFFIQRKNYFFGARALLYGPINLINSKSEQFKSCVKKILFGQIPVYLIQKWIKVEFEKKNVFLDHLKYFLFIHWGMGKNEELANSTFFIVLEMFYQAWIYIMWVPDKCTNPSEFFVYWLMDTIIRFQKNKRKKITFQSDFGSLWNELANAY